MIEQIKRLYVQLSRKAKCEIIKFVIEQRPAGLKLRSLWPEEQVGSEAAFDLDLVNGQSGEIAFLSIATSGKHEVKRDFKVSETGRIAVEIEHDGKPSCLSVTKAPYWVYWLSGEEYQDEVAVIITVGRLRKLARVGHFVVGGDGDKSLLSIFNVRDLLRPNEWINGKLAKRKIGSGVPIAMSLNTQKKVSL